MNFGKLAAIALMLSFATVAYADVTLPKGKCAFIVASRSSIDEVNSFLAGVDDSLHRNLQVIESSNGWYAISVGVIPDEMFEDLKAERVRKGIVPEDSLCSKGAKYTRVLDEDEYLLPQVVDVSSYVPVPNDAPDLTVAGPAIAFKRPVSVDEFLYPLCPQVGQGCHYMDEKGARITDQIFTEVRAFAKVEGIDGPIARVMVGNKWGFLRHDGTWFIAPVFEDAESFSNGLAEVEMNGKTGVITTDRKWFLAPQFESLSTYNLGMNDKSHMTAKFGGKYGILSGSGNWLVTPRFDEVYNWGNSKDTAGILKVAVNGKFGLVSNTGKWIASPSYKTVYGFFENGLAMLDDSRKDVLIDRTGRVVIDQGDLWGGVNISIGGISHFELRANEAATGRTYAPNLAYLFHDGGKWGLKDASGVTLIEPRFDEVNGFEARGFAPVSENGKWGIVAVGPQFADSRALLIEPTYDRAQYWGHSLQLVRGDDAFELGDNGSLTPVEPASKFADGTAVDQGLSIISQDGKSGVQDSQDFWVVPPRYDGAALIGKLVRVDFGNNTRQGYITPDGTPVTFTEEEFTLGEIQGNQKRLEEELAKRDAEIKRLQEEKDAEIKRLQEEAANAQAQAAQTPQTSSDCDHVFVGKLFEGKMGVAGQIFGLKGTYEVLGFSATTEQVTITLTSDRSFRQQISCSQVPY